MSNKILAVMVATELVTAELVNEVKLFGQNFEGYEEDAVDENATGADVPVPAPTQAQTKSDVTKFSNVKKGKAALKTTKAKYQFQVMLSLGIPREEIHKFAESKYVSTHLKHHFWSPSVLNMSSGCQYIHITAP